MFLEIKKMKNKIRKALRLVLKTILLLVILINGWKIGEKQYRYISSDIGYRQIRKEKEQALSVPVFLSSKEEEIKEVKNEYNYPYDWIYVSNSKIDYPLMKAPDNNFYLNHNYKGKYDISGAIYYDASDEPYNGTSTIIYGHAMRNGSMFKSLHHFRDDHNKFLNSELTIYTKEYIKKYKPLGYGIFPANKPFHREIDEMNPNELRSYLKNNCRLYNDINITEESHIIGLVTCEYSINDGRIIVFYINE